MIELLDVSSCQQAIDWARVAATGIVGVYARSVWATSTDAMLTRHRSGARAARLAVGTYGVIVEGRDPTAQALAYVAARDSDEELPPALDLERGTASELADALRWCDVVEERLGREVLLYTGAWWWERAGNPAAHPLAARRLWVSSYTATPRMPRPWRSWALWQYTGTGRCGGVAGDVDRSRSEMTLAQFCALGRQLPPPLFQPDGTAGHELEIAAQRAADTEPAGPPGAPETA